LIELINTADEDKAMLKPYCSMCRFSLIQRLKVPREERGEERRGGTDD